MMDMRLDDLADSIPLAFCGLLVVLFLVVLGLINVNIGRHELGLNGLPLMAIFLWPRMAAPLLSLFFVFCAGLFQDVVNAQPLGLSAFVFVIIFAFFRCRLDRKAMTLMRVWRQFFLLIFSVAIIVVVYSFLVGLPLGLQNSLLRSIVTLLLFPLYFVIWDFVRNLTKAGEDI